MEKNMSRIRLTSLVLVVLLAVSVTSARQQAKQAEPAILTLDTVFTYNPKTLGPVQWQQDGRAYLTLEPSAGAKGALDIARYDGATGERTVLVPAEKLLPQ